MTRLLPTVLVLALLGGTAAAFAVTQTRKQEASPVFGTQIDKLFSPVCRCDTRLAHVSFRLRRAALVRLEVLAGDRVVRTLVRGKRFSRGRKSFTWNGRDDRGRLVPDGEYRPRVEVGGHEVTLPNPIRVDTVRPRIHVVSVRRGPVLRVAYRVDEPAHGLLFVDGKQRIRTRSQKLTGVLRLRLSGGRVAVAAEDRAGNVSAPVPLGRGL